MVQNPAVMEPARCRSFGDDCIAVEIGSVAGASKVARSCSGPQISPTHVYQQLPLAKGTIRVIDLDCTTDADARLTATLRVVRLKDCPSFTALSYVWGTGGTASISCNGASFAITPNCQEALLSLRSIYGAICIWVDAICINQGDNAEKDKQIPIMGEIYTWANVVYVWLGPEDYKRTRAINSLKMVSSLRFPQFGPPWIQGRGGHTVVKDRANCLIKGIWFLIWKYLGFYFMTFRWRRKLKTHCAVDDLDRLLGHEWLTRAWTFQEIVLASNPVLVCGKQMIPWLVLQRALEFYHDNSGPLNPEHSSPVHSDKIDSWWYLLLVWTSISRPTRWHGETMRLLPQGRISISVKDYSAKYLGKFQSWSLVASVSSLLLGLGLIVCPGVLAINLVTRFVQEFAATVIALCAVMFGFSLFSVASFMALFNYFKPVNRLSEVEEAVLVGMLKALRERNSSVPKDKAFALYGVLQALNVVPHGEPKVEYAIPLGHVYYNLFRELLLWDARLICLLLDVGLPIPHAPSWVPDWSTLHERSWIEHGTVYGRVTSNTDAPRIEVNGETLTVQGKLLGTPSFTTGLFKRLDSDNLDTTQRETRQDLSAAISQFSDWLGAIIRDSPVSSTYQSLPKAILDALHGRVSDFDSADGPLFNKWRQMIYPRNFRDKGASTDDLLDRVAGDPSMLEFTVKMCNNLYQRRVLFFSTDGHIGSGPPHMLLSDKIVLLNGVPGPMILREHTERPGLYQVVGPAFICGFTKLSNEAQQEQNWGSFTLI